MNNKDLFNLTIVLVPLLAVGLACSGFPGVSQQPQSSPSGAATPAPTLGQAPTPDAENEKLKEKLAELEKKIGDQQKQPAPQEIKPPAPVTRNSGGNAWVNSPGDGFLALRSEPGSDVGYRIVQIPHGANVRVGGCQSYSQRIGGRAGRWCRVSYNGYSGWAFDGWLVY